MSERRYVGLNLRRSRHPFSSLDDSGLGSNLVTMRAQTKRKLGKFMLHNWGYIVLIVVAIWWHLGTIGPLPIAIGSSLVVIFALFCAEVPCCAPNKRLVNGEIDFCGNNGNGILGACHLKRHKWLNLKSLVSRQTYVRSLKHCVSSFSGAAGSFSALAGLGSFTVALLTYLFVTTKK
ncbi:hypothetical protein [Pseudonocardia acaciae]|uniref:hypothetical protein n=1 Tax=Pseudonocardia acaciae TaxID=551276 RepID=UPI0012EECB12|nr:hypothetical protein [Pseudonocardia acaciae]